MIKMRTREIATSILEVDSGQPNVPDTLIKRKDPPAPPTTFGYHLIRSRMGYIVGLDNLEIRNFSCSSLDSNNDTLVVKPVTYSLLLDKSEPVANHLSGLTSYVPNTGSLNTQCVTESSELINVKM